MFLILWVLFAIEGQAEPTNKVAKEGLQPPAAGVLRPGDEIVSIDGRRGGPEEFRAATARHRCPDRQTDGCRATTPAVVVVRRDGRLVTLRIVPRYDAAARRRAHRLRLRHRRPRTSGR